MSGQTLNDRLTAVRHAVAGQGLAGTVCKATTEEVIRPKRKHLDYLLRRTERNVSISELVNLLIERTQNTSWVVVLKALITVHHLMSYGSERFTQYLASSNCVFQLECFLAELGAQSYDMSTFIRRYAKYLNEKAVSYRTVAFDFCKCKRGREDGILWQMKTEQLLKSLPALETQLDSLLECHCSTNDLCNDVVNACFMLLFRDLIRLFAWYNDSIICLLEKYYDFNKKQARDVLDIYKKFLIRMDRVVEFLKFAENYGIEKDEIPDLTKMPSSILEELEKHLATLEGREDSTSAESAAASTLESQRGTASSPAEALWPHGSPYGRDLKDLIRRLKQDDLQQAEADVRRDVLRNISTEVNTTQEEDHLDLDAVERALTNLNLDDLVIFFYNDLQIATRGFCDQHIEAGGCKIGEGGFGIVYKAVIKDRTVAVKRLKDPVDPQFITELNVLTKYKHENLLPLLGCSLNGPSCCLVYEYMMNGSIDERLACVNNTKPLSWKTRLSIAYNSALGINHLHTFGEKPMVHRDIKSANILLDENFIPKVGDFGLVRIGSSNASTTTAVTLNVYGTSVYMAREAFYGDVSVKLDTYSFGVVLLELLTALPPFDKKREDQDLVTHMQNCDNILLRLDPKTDWNPDAAKKLHRIAKWCLTESKRERPAISEILQDLKTLMRTANL